MSDNIRITMVGTSGAGKTCYLYAMYAEMAFGVNGFTFMPTDYDKSIDLEDGWQLITKGIWPDGNVESFDYEFECSYSLRPLMRFSWHDYRGAILTEKESQSDREKLFKKLNDSSTLIMCISAEMVQSALQGSPAALKDLRRYMQILREYFVTNGKTVPVVLTITKADLLQPGEFTKSKDFLMKDIFNVLFEEGGEWMIMVTAVTLGNLRNNDGKVEGNIEPLNIHLPVMFALYVTLVGALASTQRQLETVKDHKVDREHDWEQENRKSGWKRFWNGDYRDIISADLSELEKQINSLGNNAEKLKQDLERIMDELYCSDAQTNEPPAYLFYDGSPSRWTPLSRPQSRKNKREEPLMLGRLSGW